MSYKYGNKFGYGFQNNHSQHKHRINYAVRSPSIRVVFEGTQLGIMSVDAAMKIASEKSLDLVELIPSAKPPVCHILNYQKYLYKEKIKEKDKKKNSKINESKEIRFKSCIEDHDLNTKANQAKSFLVDGKKVQITLRFKNNRELSHKEKGFELMNRFLSCIGEDSYTVEKSSFMAGNQIICKLNPKIQN
jgi:translation initiation factor IF-3